VFASNFGRDLLKDVVAGASQDSIQYSKTVTALPMFSRMQVEPAMTLPLRQDVIVREQKDESAV
jgi:hypothetical protein